MSGFDKTKFINLSKDVEEELSCGICLNLLNNPMTTPCCRHSYCSQCINEWLNVQKTCPNDRQSLTKQNLVKSSRIVTNLLDRQEVYCDYRTYGCQQIVRLSQLSQHLTQCSFDPNRAHDKCHQILRSIESSVDKLKNHNKSPQLSQDLAQLKSQISQCRREVNLLNSKLNSVNKTVYIQPNTDSFKLKIMESAKNNVENPQVISHVMSEGLKRKIIKKSKEAILSCSNYEEIAKYLVDVLDNEDHDWSASVYPLNSVGHLIGDFSFKIELSFGDLCIFLVSHPYNGDSNEESESGSDPQTYDDYEDDDVQTHYNNHYNPWVASGIGY